MLRFIKHNLSSIDGISIYPILSLLIFVLFFILVITYVVRMKKAEITELSSIPLEENSENDFKEK
jgi:fructose-specific phosphotransferase system IIC component